MAKRSAVVFGATGLVGESLVRQLCEQEDYISVTAIGRKALDFEHEKLEQKIHSLEELTESDIRYAQDVFCCLGTTMKKAGTKAQFEKVDFEYPMSIASLAKNQQVEHFIVISAMGASEKAMAYYSRVKGKLETELVKLEFPRLSIIRPSLLTGNRPEFRFGEKVGEKVLKVFNPLLVGGLKKYRSIEANQVATAMIALALSENKTPVKIYKSNELAALQLPKKLQVEEEKVDKEAVFNWSKINGEQGVLDEEVTFDRSKIKTVDRERK
jgi:dTDP-4-dehydrorhamnose reductase